MTNDQLRRKVLKHIDEEITEKGGGVLRIDSKKFSKEINEDAKRVNIALEDLSDRDYLESDPVADSGTSIRKLIKVRLTAKGRDYLEGKIKSGTGELNFFKVGNITGDQVAVGKNISQEQVQVINKVQIKNKIDEADQLEEEEKVRLKERVDELEEELEKANPNKSILARALRQLKDAGIDQGFSLAVNYIIQQIMASI